MKKYVELVSDTSEKSGAPILIDVSAITIIKPQFEKCSLIWCAGIDHSICVRITYKELVAKLTALGVCQVV